MRDGIVLPILHLNGYKIANPTVLARQSEEELTDLLLGYGYNLFLVAGDEPEQMHQAMPVTLDAVLEEIQTIKQDVEKNGFFERPDYLMIVLRSPKGWTGPETVNGLPVEDSFRSPRFRWRSLLTNPNI